MTTTTAIVRRIAAELPIVSIVPAGATKSRKSRLGQFAKWLQDSGRTWATPDLQAYRDHLLGRLKPSSAKGHLSTIRARYREIVENNATRDLLYDMAAASIAERGTQDTETARKAFVDEVITRMTNGTNPKHSRVEAETTQDKVDSSHGVRLTRDQASALLATPGTVPIMKLRDTAILAMFLCTGIREGELVGLDVEDLRQTIDGAPCLHVRHGKGNKTRAVIYGGNSWVLVIIDKWLEAAGIVEGPVFRGFYRDARTLRPGRLSTRAVQKIVSRYPVMIDTVKTAIHPHDLRRTYARIWYDMGGDLVGLQQNLGHADLKTTLNYVGVLDVSKRAAPSMYSFDWAALDEVDVQGAPGGTDA